MGTFKARGIVLKEFHIGESDKIITVFAKEYGRLSVSARGARKAKSKFLAATQPFCYADFVIFEGKGFYSLTQVELIESFYSLRTDLDLLSYSSYFCELVEKTAFEGMAQDDLLLFLLKTLQAVSKVGIKVQLAARVFELRLLALSGFLPELESCAYCKNEISDSLPSYYFDTPQGGLICQDCLKNTPGIYPIRIKKATLIAISYIINSSVNKAFSFYADDFTLKEIKKVTASCLLLFLDIGGAIKINSLEFIE